jgi:hypothetical protein
LKPECCDSLANPVIQGRTGAKNASIPLKMYLKSLVILENASISLKKSSKIIKIFIKAPNF